MLSFHAGTSGRFLTTVLWYMMNHIDEVIPFSENNSAHVIRPWEGQNTYRLSSWDCNAKDVYKDIEWINPGIIATHTYPDFEELQHNPNLANVKVILILVDEDDYEEVAHNCFVKNSELEPQYPEDTLLHRFKRQNELKLKDQFSWMYNYTDASLIPESLKDRILIVKYKELYEEVDGSYVALEKLKALLGTDILPNTFKSYQTYVNNRNRLWNR